MKKKANASGDNGWADRVSICHFIIISKTERILYQYVDVTAPKRITGL